MDMEKIVEKINNIFSETAEICFEVDNCYSCPLNINGLCFDMYLRKVVINLKEKIIR